MGYAGEPFEIELTYDGRDYEIGSAFGHVATGVTHITQSATVPELPA